MAELDDFQCRAPVHEAPEAQLVADRLKSEQTNSAEPVPFGARNCSPLQGTGCHHDGRDGAAELKQRWSAGLIGENEVGGRHASAIQAWCGRFDAVEICGLSGSRSPDG